MSALSGPHSEEKESLLLRNSRRPVLSRTGLHRMRQRTRVAGLGRRQWMAFAGVGDSLPAVACRMLLLWLLAVPILVVRGVLALAAVWLTMGALQLVSATAVTAGTMTFQSVYRDVMWYATSSPEFQRAWDVMATATALSLSILVWTTRLLVEVHNGLCPLYDLLADALLVVCEQLALLWYSAPVLQQFASWLLRLLVYLVEPVLDCLVTIFETFMYMARELAQVAEAGGEAGITGIQDEGEMLLRVVVVVCTVLVRVTQALLVVFAPLLYAFFRMVLPMLLPLIPLLLSLGAEVAAVLTSEGCRRVIFYVVESIPVVLESIGAIVCDLVVYLGAAFCYVLYGMAMMLSFLLEYVIRPLVCGAVPLFAGCMEAFMASMFDGDSCYSCNGYNTACGCKYDYEPRDSRDVGGGRSCGGDVCVRDGDPATVPPSRPGGDKDDDAARWGGVATAPDTFAHAPIEPTDWAPGASPLGVASLDVGDKGDGPVDLTLRRRGSPHAHTAP